MQTFTVIYLIILSLTIFTKIWLATRQIRHVCEYRDSVPENFSTQINLNEHHKAADYTCAKVRLSYINILLGVLLLLALTLGGGINVIVDFCADWLNNSLARGMALIVITMLLMSLTEIPIDFYRTFVVEQKFGFNKMTPAMFLRI